MSIPMCVIQTSNFIAQHVACKNKYRNKYLDYVRLGNKTHLFACKDLYEKLMHFMHLECTCIGWKSHHTLSTRSHRSLLKFLFLEEYLYTHYFVCTQKFFPGCNIYYSRVTTHTVSLYYTLLPWQICFFFIRATTL